ncbi:MAG: HAMP domain-containing protein [Dehalococcoidales bacterium]|nr:MAG: HAMP domain-containing protein [Dehalococcoidales bacterium]
MFIKRVYQRIRNWLRESVQRKLIFWSTGFWIISVLILSVSFLWTGQSEILSDIRNRNIQVASIISRDINYRVSGILSDIRLFSRHLESIGSDLSNQTSALLTFRLSSPQRYHAVYYFDENYKLLVHMEDPTDALLSSNITEQIISRPAIPIDIEIFAAAQSTYGRDMYISDVYLHGLERLPVLYVSLPLEISSEHTRTLVFQVDIQDIWQRINLSTVGESGFAYAVTRNGMIITHPDLEQLGKSMPSELQGVMNGYEGFIEYFDSQKERNLYAAYSPVGSPTNWGIIVEQDKFEANAPILRTTIIIIIISAALATIGTVGILIMMQNSMRPILELTKTTRQIGRTGELITTSMEERIDEVGQLSQSFDEMIERLQSMEGRLATVAEEERNRLARDLHDAVSQTLFSASLIAEVLPSLWEKDQEKGKERLEEVRQLTRGALAEMRTLLLELRPSALIEAELPHLLEQLAEAITGRVRIPVVVTVEGDCIIADDEKIGFYRIAQEALNNVAKHSEAAYVTVSLICSKEKITLKIKDNGIGFEIDTISHDSLGIGIMQERAEDIGAIITIRSQVGEGTEIVVTLDNRSEEDIL